MCIFESQGYDSIDLGHVCICEATSEKGPDGWQYHYAENDVRKKITILNRCIL